MNRDLAVQQMLYESGKVLEKMDYLFTNYNQLYVARSNGIVQELDPESGTEISSTQVFEKTVDAQGKIVLNKHKQPEHFIGLAAIESYVSCPSFNRTELTISAGSLHVQTREIFTSKSQRVSQKDTHSAKTTCLHLGNILNTEISLLPAETREICISGISPNSQNL